MLCKHHRNRHTPRQIIGPVTVLPQQCRAEYMANWSLCMEIEWTTYDPGECYDEMISSPGYPRRAARAIASYLQKLSARQLGRRQNAADLAIAEMGVTFTVYSEGANIDRTWPFDIIPRIIPLKEWPRIEEGLEQRMTALNMFIHDLYHEQKVITDGIVPKKLISGSKASCRSASTPVLALTCGHTSAGQTWYATGMAPSMCSKTTCVYRPASPT